MNYNTIHFYHFWYSGFLIICEVSFQLSHIHIIVSVVSSPYQVNKPLNTYAPKSNIEIKDCNITKKWVLLIGIHEAQNENKKFVPKFLWLENLIRSKKFKIVWRNSQTMFVWHDPFLLFRYKTAQDFLFHLVYIINYLPVVYYMTYGATTTYYSYYLYYPWLSIFISVEDVW